jgi:EAL domain-containing protein (putative c-di-GMP-specific phosphodiesterase class I)
VQDKIDYAMVKAINDIGHTMEMQTVAEFVENNDIKKMLIKLGVNYVQGYGIHRPQPFEEILGL